MLSAGIDGRLDNDLPAEDTLFMDSWRTRIKAYNMDNAWTKGEYNRISRENMDKMAGEELIKILPEYPKVDITFSLWNYLFGRKDYIVQIGEIAFFPGDYFPEGLLE